MGAQQARAQLLPSLVMLITWARYHKHSQYPNWGISTVHHPSYLRTDSSSPKAASRAFKAYVPYVCSLPPTPC